MTAQSIVCGTCSAPVAYGRLSCPSCGELLASVAGARRPSSTATAVASPQRTPDVLYDAASAPTVGVTDGHLALDGANRDVDAELPWAGAADSPAVDIDPRSGWDVDGDVGVDDDVDADDMLGYVEAGGAEEDDADEPGGESSSTAGHAWAVAGASLTGPTTPAYMPRPKYPQAAAPPEAPPVTERAPGQPVGAPGAYVPPLPVTAIPAGPPAPARAWAGYADAAADASTGRDAKGAEGRAIDPSRVAEFIGSVSIAGAALAAVGFLLPWASVMIGASGSQYFDRWGLAGPGHVVVVSGILALLALSLVRNPIPTWIRTGIGGLAVGSLLLGLTWPYLLGPLDAAPGVLIDAIGAIALIGSGVLAIATDRHAEVDKPV
jgi:hypothetical protein